MPDTPPPDLPPLPDGLLDELSDDPALGVHPGRQLDPTPLPTQGMRVDSITGAPTLVLLNAQDLVFGL